MQGKRNRLQDCSGNVPQGLPFARGWRGRVTIGLSGTVIIVGNYGSGEN